MRSLQTVGCSKPPHWPRWRIQQCHRGLRKSIQSVDRRTITVQEQNNPAHLVSRWGKQLDSQSKASLMLFQVSTVTNVEDTKTTIKQGNNIRMLTLITIAYLPLSYVTVCSLKIIWSRKLTSVHSLYSLCRNGPSLATRGSRPTWNISSHFLLWLSPQLLASNLFSLKRAKWRNGFRKESQRKQSSRISNALLEGVQTWVSYSLYNCSAILGTIK